ncbi:coiled-coil domain-containing protein 142 isoform X2 [Fukomys damarensis]|uniref:coiled-coil domain-containing protein 142 isoform X2 n=1 Tax=Fukomys damarensis TaxID=885580 RepID=UPI00053FD332|nr:coiled-coil domain-containing protein 142 isoform X2 [Fukomys damarensis]
MPRITESERVLRGLRGSCVRDRSCYEAESELRLVLGGTRKQELLGSFSTRPSMAQASRPGGLLPPRWAQSGGTVEEQWEGRRAGALRGEGRGWQGLPFAGSIPYPDLRPGGPPRGPPWWAVSANAGVDHEVGAAGWKPQPAAGSPVPPALQRLRRVLLRLLREREQLLQARDYARHLQAVVRLLKTLSPSTPTHVPGPLPHLCRDLQLHPPGEALVRIRQRDSLEPLLIARPIGLATQRLDAAIEMQLRALGRAPASLNLTSQLAELLLLLPLYHRLQEKAVSYIPGAARPFPSASVLRLLTRERGCQMASWLDEALGGLCLPDQLRRHYQKERELLPGLLGLVGDMTGSVSSGLGLEGAGNLWSQYWMLLWATCMQSLDLNLGPWRKHRAVAQQLSEALVQASLPQECEKELASSCHNLLHQSLIWSWDQGPAPIALGLCTLQITLLWFLGRTQQYLAAWAPDSFLLLIQKHLPPLLHEVEALSRLTSEESLSLAVEQQLGLEFQKLTAQMQLLPEESLSLFFQECHKQATQGFKLYMPQGRYWRLRLCPELPRVPSEYAGLVVHTVLDPVLQGVQGLPPQAQALALSQALTAILGAWLDHILTHGIRFSLQGALQLRQDFGVVKELLEEEQWDLSPELRQTLLMLSIFQQLDGALLCLLQQPLPKTRGHRTSPCCCVGNEVQTTGLASSSLNSLENLEPPVLPGVPPAQTTQLQSTLGGGRPSLEAYLVGNQQAWLALRQHQQPRWHLPFLSCLGISPES